MHQPLSGFPYPVAKICQMAGMLERARTHVNNLTWPVGGDWDRLGGIKAGVWLWKPGEEFSVKYRGIEESLLSA